MESIAKDTPGELRLAIEAGWDEFLTAVAGAGEGWEEITLVADDQAEDSWSPRQAAWHVVSGASFRNDFLRYILSERPTLPADTATFATSKAGMSALATLSERHEVEGSARASIAAGSTLKRATSELLTNLKKGDLDVGVAMGPVSHKYLRGLGFTQSDDLRGMLLNSAVHLRDHARQIIRGTGS